MSGVDVLKAMDRAAGGLFAAPNGGPTLSTEILEARAAVAELIEAADAVQTEFAALVNIYGERSCYDMRDRLAAALDRVSP